VSSENLGGGDLAPFGPSRFVRPCRKMILIFIPVYIFEVIYTGCVYFEKYKQFLNSHSTQFWKNRTKMEGSKRNL
jgi:hypothetical protein